MSNVQREWLISQTGPSTNTIATPIVFSKWWCPPRAPERRCRQEALPTLELPLDMHEPARFRIDFLLILPLTSNQHGPQGNGSALCRYPPRSRSSRWPSLLEAPVKSSRNIPSWGTLLGCSTNAPFFHPRSLSLPHVSRPTRVYGLRSDAWPGVYECPTRTQHFEREVQLFATSCLTRFLPCVLAGPRASHPLLCLDIVSGAWL